MIEFEFDPQKSARNWERHGVDLEWAIRLWDGDHAIIEAKSIGEARRLLIARYEGRCWAVVFTMRGETVRLISCHRADSRLERIYEEKVERKADH
jgi:uncharacterized DUF497 family protein